MNFNAVAVRLKVGYLAQVWDMEDNILWEGKKIYKTEEKAQNAAYKKVNSSIERFFSDE